MVRPSEDLGLCPDLLRLPSWVQDLIRHGNHTECSSHSEASVAVCAEMFWVGYALDEVWMVLTNPAHGISKEFFARDGEEAEAYLEKIISMAHQAAKPEGRVGNG